MSTQEKYKRIFSKKMIAWLVSVMTGLKHVAMTACYNGERVMKETICGIDKSNDLNEGQE